MNIIAMRQEQRRNKINQLIATLKEAKLEGREVDKAKFLLMIMSTLGLSERTAKEYIKVAEFESD